MRARLSGYVVSDDDAFFYRYFGIGVTCPRDVREGVRTYAGAPDDEGLVFEVNSPGGSLFAGLEMWTALMDSKRLYNIACTAEVQSIAASAASVFIAGCDKVGISPVAQVMMHLPATTTQGNENDHRESLGMLVSGLESILAAYETKCGKKTPREELEKLCRSTAFLTAKQAVAVGIADYIIAYKAEDDADPTSMVACVGAGIRSLASCAGLPDIAVLRAKYEASRDGGKSQTGGGDEGGTGDDPELVPGGTAADILSAGGPAINDDWRPRARLEIEKLKFG